MAYEIFAIESSAKSASAALIDGGVLLGEFYIHTQLTHSETLMPMAEALLQNTRFLWNRWMCLLFPPAQVHLPGSGSAWRR